MNKAIVIVLAVIALGLFAVAGSVIYATQQIPSQPTSVKTQFENDLLLNCTSRRVDSGLGEVEYGGYIPHIKRYCLYLLSERTKP